jgi:hypothetical protein
MVWSELLNFKKKAKSIPKSLKSSNFSRHEHILGGGKNLKSCLFAKYSEACGSVKKTIVLEFVFSASVFILRKMD